MGVGDSNGWCMDRHCRVGSNRKQYKVVKGLQYLASNATLPTEKYNKLIVNDIISPLTVNRSLVSGKENDRRNIKQIFTKECAERAGRSVICTPSGLATNRATNRPVLVSITQSSMFPD